jgi:hypothetical protein
VLGYGLAPNLFKKGVERKLRYLTRRKPNRGQGRLGKSANRQVIESD